MAYIPPRHAGEQQPGFDSHGFPPFQTPDSQQPPYFESQGQAGFQSQGGDPNDHPAASASRAGAIQWGSHTNANTSSIGMGYAEMHPQQQRGHEPSPIQQQGGLAWEMSQQPSYSQSHPSAGLGHPQQQHEQPPLGPLRGVQLQQNQTTKLSPTSLDVILHWDEINKKNVDLDASCVLFDDIGNVIDGVFYNQLQTADGSIKHSGDVIASKSDSSQGGSTEQIRIDLPRLAPNVKAMALSITCYSKGDSFKDVETAEVQLRDSISNQQLAYYGIGSNGQHTALIMAVLYRVEASQEWILKAVGQPGEGRHFMDLVPHILKILEKDNVIDPILAGERARNKAFDLKKGDEFEIPDDLTHIAMGLGWDIEGGLTWDLDCSALLFRYEEYLESVYYFNLKSKDGAIVHKGDNTTGEGEGDDEQITVNLKHVSKKINTIIFGVTVFTPEGNFSKIKNAFCRLVNIDTGKEVCRYTLSEYSTKTAQIMCKIYRESPSRWRFLAVGEGASGQIYKHLVPQVKPWLDKEPPKRKLAVIVHEARNLTGGSSLNSYAEARFDTDSQKTKVVKHTQNPDWHDHSFSLSGSATCFEVNIFDHHTFKKDKFTGRCVIRLGPDPPNYKKKWLSLQLGSSNQCGEVCISVSVS